MAQRIATCFSLCYNLLLSTPSTVRKSSFLDINLSASCLGTSPASGEATDTETALWSDHPFAAVKFLSPKAQFILSARRLLPPLPKGRWHAVTERSKYIR